MQKQRKNLGLWPRETNVKGQREEQSVSWTDLPSFPSEGVLKLQPTRRTEKFKILLFFISKEIKYKRDKTYYIRKALLSETMQQLFL